MKPASHITVSNTVCDMGSDKETLYDEEKPDKAHNYCNHLSGTTCVVEPPGCWD
jgi:hypothetical protein